MTRKEKYVKLASHPICSNYFKKLTATDMDYIAKFLTATEELSTEEYMAKANMVFVDDPNKPKNHTDIWSILINCK